MLLGIVALTILRISVSLQTVSVPCPANGMKRSLRFHVTVTATGFKLEKEERGIRTAAENSCVFVPSRIMFREPIFP